MTYTAYRNTESGEQITKSELERRFDEFLDDTNDQVTIAGMDFTPSALLKATDPIAYRETLLGYSNDEWEETRFEDFDVFCEAVGL